MRVVGDIPGDPLRGVPALSRWCCEGILDLGDEGEGNEDNESSPHPSKGPGVPGRLRTLAEDMAGVLGNQGDHGKVVEPEEGAAVPRTKQGVQRGERHPAGTGRGRRAADKARSHKQGQRPEGAGTRSGRRTSSERTATGMVVVDGQNGWTHARLVGRAGPARGRVMCRN